MDVPTRQSYVMAVVKPGERTFASWGDERDAERRLGGRSLVCRAVMQHIALAGPLVVGGLLKIGYDLILYTSFRHVRPPEEERTRRSRRPIPKDTQFEPDRSIQ